MQAISTSLIKVMPLDQLKLFADAFKIEKESFNAFKQKSIQSNVQQDVERNQILAMNVKKYFEFLGEDSHVVRLLKVCNSATISPVIIELKTALGAKYMTKDVSDTWKFDIIIKDEDIVVKSRKQEQELKSLFTYEWEIAISFSRDTITCQDINLYTFNIQFSEKATPEQKNDILSVLNKYSKPSTPTPTPPQPIASPSQQLNQSKGNASVAPQPTAPTTTVSQRLLRTSSSTVVRTSSQPLIFRTETYENGDHYEGEFNEAGERHGRGTYTTPFGDIYIGEYRNGLRCGKGVYTMKDGTRYEGELDIESV